MLTRSRHDREGHDPLAISRLVDGEWDALTRARLLSQITECWECQDLLRILESASTHVRSLRTEHAGVPCDVGKRLHDDLPSRSHSLRRRMVSYGAVPGVMGTVAASLVLLLASSYLARPGLNQPANQPEPVKAQQSASRQPVFPVNDMTYQPMLAEGPQGPSRPVGQGNVPVGNGVLPHIPV